jgi:hypothetical protein
MSRASSPSTSHQPLDLAASPDAQHALALELVERERDLGVLRAALEVLARDPQYRDRRVLLRRYAACEADPSKHDPGCFVRVALLGALRPLAAPEDAGLLARACATVEFLPPGPTEVAAGLRAAALGVLNEVDDALAGYHAVRLLHDPYLFRVSGEPGVTAAQVLASQAQHLPLYAYVVPEHAPARQPDVTAECLRGLLSLPAPLVRELADRYLASEDEIVLLGLFDLLLGHPASDDFLDLVFDFLRATRLLGIYRYVVTTLVAARRAVGRVEALLAGERDAEKAAILREALALR